MAGWAGRRNAARRGVSRTEAQWLTCIVFVICALGFHDYKYWNAPPPTGYRRQSVGDNGYRVFPIDFQVNHRFRYTRTGCNVFVFEDTVWEMIVLGK
jgi:hypothetical protein